MSRIKVFLFNGDSRSDLRKLDRMLVKRGLDKGYDNGPAGLEEILGPELPLPVLDEEDEDAQD